MFAAGRKQQVYKILDVSPKFSPPICILFSASLMILISVPIQLYILKILSILELIDNIFLFPPVLLLKVHINDIIFRHAVTGDELMKNSNIVPQGEITVAILDNREKKLLIGDSQGNLRIYNILSGILIKLIPVSSSSLLQLVYSPDKIILCLTGSCDVIAVDDSPR